MAIQRYFPMQGSKAFETTSCVVVDTFRVTATGNSAAGTSTLRTYPKGATILGFRGRVTTAFTSTGSGTLSVGFTGTSQLSEVYAKTSIDAVNDIVGPAATNTAGPLVLTADDTFDFITGTAKWTTGAMDVDVIYVPPPDGVADSTFYQYALT